jgi:hypothetical protein
MKLTKYSEGYKHADTIKYLWDNANSDELLFAVK